MKPKARCDAEKRAKTPTSRNTFDVLKQGYNKSMITQLPVVRSHSFLNTTGRIHTRGNSLFKNDSFMNIIIEEESCEPEVQSLEESKDHAGSFEFSHSLLRDSNGSGQTTIKRDSVIVGNHKTAISRSKTEANNIGGNFTGSQSPPAKPLQVQDSDEEQYSSIVIQESA